MLGYNTQNDNVSRIQYLGNTGVPSLCITNKDLDRDVVNPSQIRNIIREMKPAVNERSYSK